MKNNLTNIIAAGALALGVAGCCNYGNDSKEEELKTITVKPISASGVVDRSDGAFAAVGEYEGKPILIYDNTFRTLRVHDHLAQTEAIALYDAARATTNDVKVTGKYEGNKFKVKKLETLGYIINFEGK